MITFRVSCDISGYLMIYMYHDMQWNAMMNIKCFNNQIFSWNVMKHANNNSERYECSVRHNTCSSSKHQTCMRDLFSPFTCWALSICWLWIAKFCKYKYTQIYESKTRHYIKILWLEFSYEWYLVTEQREQTEYWSSFQWNLSQIKCSQRRLNAVF